MGLFGFGRKKSDEALLAEAMALYRRGKKTKAGKTLFPLVEQNNAEALYWVGRIYAEVATPELAQRYEQVARIFLQRAADQGHAAAAALLAERRALDPAPAPEADAPAAAEDADG